MSLSSKFKDTSPYRRLRCPLARLLFFLVLFARSQIPVLLPLT